MNNDSNPFNKSQNKGTKRLTQEQTIFQYLLEFNATASMVADATGVPQNNNGTPVTFTSLGFGGEITLVFDYAVFDKAGPDLFVTETSGSNNYPEKAEFYVTVMNGSNCSSTGISTLSARFYQTENNVPDESGVSSVYPNPFSNSFAFGFTAGTFDEKVNIQVVSITGQSVYTNQFEVAGQETISKSIDFSHLPAGIYIMEISSSNGKETMKMIKN